MKVTHKYHDPVNYQLSELDLDRKIDFGQFLNELTDVPASKPLQDVTIDQAGITNQQIIVSLYDIENTGAIVPVMCDIEVGVDLTNHRGIHMSRCEQVLFAAVEQTYHSLDEFAVVVAKNLIEKQASERSKVSIHGVYLHKRLTRKSQLISHDKLHISSEVNLKKGELPQISTSLTAYNMTACPCTRTYTKFSIVPQLQNIGYKRQQIQEILDITHSGTHTQRGTISITLDNHEQKVSYLDLYKILDNSTHLIYELLKRPDEHDLVVRALNKPQFTEDVAREVAYSLYQSLHKTVPTDTQLEVKSVLLDSIHIHDVCTLIDKTFGEIAKEVTAA